MTDYITTQEAAAIIGCGKRHVNKLCAGGALVCQKFGIVYQVERASAEQYARTEHKSGPKPRLDEYGWSLP
jgi:hypothetical protein